MRRLLLCLLPLLTPALLHAQEAGKISCRFLGLEGAKPPPALLNAGEGGVETACTVPAGSLSPETSCVVKNGIITFLNASDRKPAATAKIPANLKHAILVFLAAGKPGAGGAEAQAWRVFVIEDSAKNFPDGGAYVTNLHSQDIRFVLGENKTQLKPGSSHGFERPAKRDDFNMAPVAFQFQQKETWVTASESNLRFSPGTRYLIFAYVDPTTGRPRISTCTDAKKPPADT